ncbi:hypothetical protein AB3G45_11275 [Shinella sp. S4-D37]|uniref:hypothetical protein n=1 Tax=Shinella sp. S4-D37 TaxID=3161999 RepID=UPI0034659287
MIPFGDHRTPHLKSPGSDIVAHAARYRNQTTRIVSFDEVNVGVHKLAAEDDGMAGEPASV